MSDPIHILSLGAGVQSSAMALMAAAGEITPMPEFAVFADTGDEPQEVYWWLEKLTLMLPFRVKIAHRVVPFIGPTGKLSDHIIEYDHSQIPAFQVGENGKIGIGKRQCTKHWKIVPVHRKIREVTNTQRQHLPPGFVTLWQGISVDEVDRAKTSREPWITNRFPLLENRMRRSECEAYLNKRGLSVPKSACVFCPYRGRSQWRKSKSNKADWEKILRVDAELNARGEFLHPSCIPIGQIDFEKETREHPEFGFRNECEGMCGV